jgi:hypothetical protein
MRKLIVLCALVALVGCSKDKDKKTAGSPAASVDGFMLKLKQSGLSTGELAPVEVADLGGAKCRRGDVGGVEMTICEYDDASRAKKYADTGLNLVGESTGASLAEGKLLLVVADRKAVDKDGKRIDKITRAFRGQ